MKTIKLKRFALAIFGLLAISTSVISCTKDSAKTGTEDTGPHYVDQKFVGKWMWTKGSDGAYYNDNGTYVGSAYGMAFQLNIKPDGSGTCFSHVFSNLGTSNLEVNISYVGFFESDDQGHLGFFPTSGTYKSTSGENRALRGDELWDSKTGKGRNFLYQKINFTTQGGKECFQMTSSNGIVDTYFRVN